jgi:hypothetical protein
LGREGRRELKRVSLLHAAGSAPSNVIGKDGATSMRVSHDEIEDMYFEWLEENCKCDIQNEGCGCPDVTEWWLAELDDLAEALAE